MKRPSLTRNPFAPLWNGMALLWWQWALAEMGPLHPDAPRAVLRIAELEAA